MASREAYGSRSDNTTVRRHRPDMHAETLFRIAKYSTASTRPAHSGWVSHRMLQTDLICWHRHAMRGVAAPMVWRFGRQSHPDGRRVVAPARWTALPGCNSVRACPAAVFVVSLSAERSAETVCYGCLRPTAWQSATSAAYRPLCCMRSCRLQALLSLCRRRCRLTAAACRP